MFRGLVGFRGLVRGLGFRDLGSEGLGFRGLVRGWGFRGSGSRGPGFRVLGQLEVEESNEMGIFNYGLSKVIIVMTVPSGPP